MDRQRKKQEQMPTRLLVLKQRCETPIRFTRKPSELPNQKP